jgi:hypothetical protein
MKTALAVSVLAAGLLGACQVTVKDSGSLEPEPEDNEPAPTSTAAEPPAPVASTEPTGAPSDTLDKLKGKKICTEMGCIDGFNVEVEAKAWPKGKYKIVVTADDKSTTCEGALPLPACDKGKALTCKGDVKVMVSENGCALPPDQHGFGPFNFMGTPKKVGIAISREGKSVAKADFQPAFKTVQPNGPECGPTCNFASDKMTVK